VYRTKHEKFHNHCMHTLFGIEDLPPIPHGREFV
jgi:hypothetical protein